MIRADGVPVMVPLAVAVSMGTGVPPQAAPAAPQGPGGQVLQMRRQIPSSTRLLRPLLREGVPVRDPWDVALERMRPLSPEQAASAGFGAEFEALGSEPAQLEPMASPLGASFVRDPENSVNNPFGGGALVTSVQELKGT